jgi:hypothetical protein
MKIHIFNPEHDIALASGLANFTAPHAGRQLRHDLGFLPAIWAQPGDIVVADDPELAQRSWHRIAHRLNTLTDTRHFDASAVTFVPWKMIAAEGSDNTIEPWGWNSALCAMLKRQGVGESQLPSPTELQTIRHLSHRRTAATLLPKLRKEGTVGETFECTTQEEVDRLLNKYGHLVLKAPWSSSGRGIRYLSMHDAQDSTQNWLRNVMSLQGSVMVEPYYNKVKDFGMEFYSDGAGSISYLGLSLFHTENGAYTGNVLATESVKKELIGQYVAPTLLDSIRHEICQMLAEVFNGKYRGPFGVDMMVCAPTLLHPCVEINLRRTMGHVALAMSPKDDDLRRVMRIDYSSNNYRLTISRL